MAVNIVKKLIEEGLKITVVESCTGGGIANAITNIPGASEVFKQGFVPYSNEAKIKLGVRKEILERFGVYSLEAAEELARVGVLLADNNKEKLVSVGVTGSLTRNDPNNKDSKSGEVFISVKFGVKSESKKIVLENMNEIRSKSKEKIITRALEMVLEAIIC